MNVIPPTDRGKDATTVLINFLLMNDYIDNLFIKINPNDSISMIKIVFDALQYQSVVNKKFYQVISTLIYVHARKSKGCSEANMQAAIFFLKSHSLITDAFDIPERYVFTPKGEAYKKFITTKPYTNLFCKSKDDLLFIDNQFDETQFLK